MLNPSEKIHGEIRLNLTFHSESAKCDPANFNALKIFSISCLSSEVSLNVVALSPLEKMCEKYGEIRLKAFHF